MRIGGVVKKISVLLVMFAIVLFASFALAAEQAPGTVTLKASMGGVKFDHAAHAKAAKCETCHHAAKEGKALTSAHEKCSDCHTATPVAPVKANAKTAFHGNCIECHKKEAKGPQKCTECHDKNAK
jgi:hypothetical protein